MSTKADIIVAMARARYQESGAALITRALAEKVRAEMHAARLIEEGLDQ